MGDLHLGVIVKTRIQAFQKHWSSTLWPNKNAIILLKREEFNTNRESYKYRFFIPKKLEKKV